MRIGIITGSGTDSVPGIEGAEPATVETRFGAAELTRGRLAGVEVLHVSRHGAGHAKLSNHVDHRANLVALKEAGADAVLGVSVAGALDPELELGSVIVYDDLWFLSNRLPGGELCTVYDTPGDPRRGHWVYGSPYSDALRAALLAGAREVGHTVRDGGCYGYVEGPRFNTRTEIRHLAALDVVAVSQTAGPEIVLAGELELPYALLGYPTDYANGIGGDTPIETLMELLTASKDVFANVLAAALPRIDAGALAPAGTLIRFE